MIIKNGILGIFILLLLLIVLVSVGYKAATKFIPATSFVALSSDFEIQVDSQGYVICSER